MSHRPPRLIVGVDSTEGSVEALRWAAHEAARRSWPLHVITCAELPVAVEAGLIGSGVLHGASTEAIVSDQHGVNQGAVNLARSFGLSVEVTGETLIGAPAYALVGASCEDDIVVVGASLVDNTARALNQQRTADNTITVISADAIGRFPDPNIAEALQRAPGVGIERDQGEGRYINVRGAPSEFSAISVDGIQIPALKTVAARIGASEAQHVGFMSTIRGFSSFQAFPNPMTMQQVSNALDQFTA